MKKRKQNLPRPAVHRMELWWAALPTVPGHVQRGTRPVVIVSNDLGNASSPVVSVVPCTTQRHKPALPTHVYLRGYGLSSGSIAMCEQVMPLDKSCLLRHIGTVYGGMTGWLSSTLWPRSLASTSASTQRHRGTDSCEASTWPIRPLTLRLPARISASCGWNKDIPYRTYRLTWDLNIRRRSTTGSTGVICPVWITCMP